MNFACRLIDRSRTLLPNSRPIPVISQLRRTKSEPIDNPRPPVLNKNMLKPKNRILENYYSEVKKDAMCKRENAIRLITMFIKQNKVPFDAFT